MSHAQVAVVAGAGGALGHATADALAAGGFTVVALDRNEQAMSDLSGSVHKVAADPADPAVVTAAIDRIAADAGPPGVLVNVVGTFRQGDALATTPETLRLMLDVNLGPALWLSQAVAPHMRQEGSGAIVHVTARPGLEPASGMAAYGVSKAALAYLTRTASNRATLPAEVMAHAVAPEAIAGVIAFLVSDAAAPVSGAILPV
jgi:NAD(P)-dependent dehydrogenase (short-subunit alcohol dehydrogenase family)